jgi:hypothetical protein
VALLVTPDDLQCAHVEAVQLHCESHVRIGLRDFDELADDLATSDELRSAPKPYPGGVCADYFVFGVTIADTTQRTDECGRPPNDVVARIIAIVADATPL